MTITFLKCLIRIYLIKQNLRMFSANNLHSAIRNLTPNLMKIMINTIY